METVFSHGTAKIFQRSGAHKAGKQSDGSRHSRAADQKGGYGAWGFCAGEEAAGLFGVGPLGTRLFA